MENQALIAEVSELFTQQTEQVNEMFKQQMAIVADMFADVNARLDSVENEVKKTRLAVETNVSHRIDALFDGYKLIYEKQGEQQAEIKNINQRLLTVENRGA